MMAGLLLAKTLFDLHPLLFLCYFLLPPFCPIILNVMGIGRLPAVYAEAGVGAVCSSGGSGLAGLRDASRHGRVENASLPPNSAASTSVRCMWML